ncbi:MAG TPA: GNAT family N-acetyltransferase [Ktedonobacterales bacterium]|nr:GNAT family N-acetyltransferase [Ktedonobacterales bacterium]HEX5572857.1 GNAT family N-acetyltransferase [Ktedonobacterales bacterium]
MPSASKPPTGYRFAPLRPGTPHFDEAVRRYLAIWPGEAQGIADFFTRYAALPDYQGLVALRADGEGGANGTTVGHGFGVRSLPGNWWHDKVAAQVGAEHPALRDAWVLVNLAVSPEERGRGIGGALMEALLAAQPCPRALLSTEVGNATARRLYERHGWSYLHPGFVFTSGDQPFVVMARPRLFATPAD